MISVTANVTGGTSMQKLLITVTVAALGFALPAYAGIISLNAPYDLGPTFTPLPGNMVRVFGGAGGIVVGYPGCCPVVYPEASFDTNFTGQLTSNYNYTASGTGRFSYYGVIYDPIHDPNGNVITVDQLSATIMWNSIHFVDDGSYSVGPSLYGTGLVTSSTGDAAFETDFPTGGTFNITADFLSECGRSPEQCTPDRVVSAVLIGGSVDPTGLAAVPSPLIGKPGSLMLLCLAVLGLVRRHWNGVNRG